MRDHQQPLHIVVGVTSEGQLRWRIQRTEDSAICGMDMSFEGDDGVDILRSPEPREWRHPDQAALYMARLEDGTAGTGHDRPVVWMYFTDTIDPPHIDGPL